MSRLKLLFSLLFITLASLFACMNAQAQDEQGTITIVTPVPAPKETVVIPQGYTSCFTVSAGWYKGVWYPEHRVCQYNPDQTTSAQGDAWVEGHWACVKYSTEEQIKGQCTNWEWRSGYWVKTLPVY